VSYELKVTPENFMELKEIMHNSTSFIKFMSNIESSNISENTKDFREVMK